MQGEFQVQQKEPDPKVISQLLETVPEWFGQPDSNAEYIRDAGRLETWHALDVSGNIIGAILINQHFPHEAEVHLMLVDRAHHGKGVGTAMLAAVETSLVQRSVQLLQVKTLGASHPDEGYATTRHFYESKGFLALEETDLWGEETPCLIMVKPLTN